ncbi:SDR family NAD(P)-dependent oxidoreductase [Stutzerimonas azotifigens]|uniref:SDR family NAD(P)-dependent oxidoreductase n=1 Tax=Stutzerimonas azotifigens TaxID=291995 RepID=UPI001376DE8B|nr:glucose 1-dehydrogenase [Stutzerimonas azotifigens]
MPDQDMTVVQPCRLRGRVCLVTGGGSGIGRATALLMAREGARAVVVAGRREDEGNAVAAQARRHGCRSLFIRTDVTREEDVVRLIERTVEEFGGLDVAFNNAGLQEKRAPLERQGSEVYTRIFNANVRSVFLCLKYQIPHMVAQGDGRIVINASVSGMRNPNPGLALYSASKAAVISLTRSAALECAPRGLRINAIAPGRVVTDMMLSSGIADMSAVGASLPLRRMGSPEEVAEAVVWLSSDQSAYVVGHVLVADGGFMVT